MKFVILIIGILLCHQSIGQHKYWEQFSQIEKQKILTRQDVLPFALEFYNDKWKSGEDSVVLDFLDKISINKNTELLPFYYYLFIKMCKRSDGYIGEVMGTCSINFLLNHPNYILSHIRQELNKSNNEEYQYFKENIVVEYYVSDFENTEISFKELEQRLSKTTSPDNLDLENKLLKEIKLGAEKLIVEDRDKVEKLKQLK